ncbi:hypothetical protein K449DRAFT_390781 [Hypoxylon sp. EC38]|nr:hypothetical protein K449DRAFT_390781 [Hypoxylon sp. EC38]
MSDRFMTNLDDFVDHRLFPLARHIGPFPRRRPRNRMSTDTPPFNTQRKMYRPLLHPE